jgi:hypothetical protein
MITLTENVNIVGGTAPYHYVITSTCSNLNIVDPVGDTSDSVIPVTVEFTDEQQLTNCKDSMTITVTDADDCTFTLPLIFTNPCEDLQLIGGISEVGELRFTVSPTGGNAPYTYTWVYPAGLDIVGSNGDNGILELAYNANSPVPRPTTITVIVEDANGCSQTDSYVIGNCVPATTGKTATIYCVDGSYATDALTLLVKPCAGQTIDWDTLTFTGFFNTTTGLSEPSMTVNNLGNGQIEVTSDSTNLTGASYQATWSVQTTSGIDSLAAVLNLIPSDCPETSPSVEMLDLFKQAKCGDTTLSVNLENALVGDASLIDWSSYTTTSGPDKSGASVAFNAGTRVLTYTIGTEDTGVDKVDFTLDTLAGATSGTISFLVDLDCDEAPVANDDTYTVDFNDTTTLNILSNDTGNINPDTITILTYPQEGNLSVVDGQLIYISDVDEGVYTFTYKVNNTNGTNWSNIATGTITVGCGTHTPTLVVTNATVTYTAEFISARFAAINDSLQIEGYFGNQISADLDIAESYNEVQLYPGVIAANTLGISQYGWTFTGITTNGYIDRLGLAIHDGNQVLGVTEVDLSATVYTGTTTGEFTTWAETTLPAALEAAMAATDFPGLGTGAEVLTNYNYQITYTAGTGTANIYFHDIANVGNYWIGVSRSLAEASFNTNGSTPAAATVNGTGLVVSRDFIQDSPCGELIASKTWRDVIDVNNIDFFSLAINEYDQMIISTTADGLTSPNGNTVNLDETCDVYTMVASTTSNCLNTVYLWEIDTGSGYTEIEGETTNILKASTSGDYRVTITCLDNGCSDTSAATTIP